MNSVRILGRRAAFAPTHSPNLQQPSRSFSAFRSIEIPQSRMFAYKPRISTIQRALPRNPKSQNVGRWRLNSTQQSTKQSPNPTPQLGSPEPAPSLSQRLKKLSREYGWSAVGVYLALSALDFPFCFLAVRALGTERIGQWEHAVIEFFKSVASVPFPGLIKDTGEHGTEASEEAQAAIREGNIALDTELSKAGLESNASKTVI